MGWALLPFERSNSFFYSLFAHPSLPLAPADPVTFFSVNLWVCYWWDLRAAVFSKAACQQTLSTCSDSHISAAAPVVVFPLGDFAWTIAKGRTKDTEMHNCGLTNAREPAHEHPQRMSERPVHEQWMGEEPACVFLCFQFFLSLVERKVKMIWGQAFLPADFTVRCNLSGSKS